MYASAGDVSTVGGKKVVKKKKAKGSGDGLSKANIDVQIIQDILFSRPTGEDKNGDTWTHELYDYIICTDHSQIGVDIILKSINKAAQMALFGKTGEKFICIYFTGHGVENHGDWAINDESISL